MELKEYLRILKKEKLTISITIVLAVLIGFLYSAKQAPGYIVEQTFLIEATRSAVKQPSEISSASISISTQEEARNFTDTAVALIKDKDSQTPPHISVSAQKEAPQLIKIIVTAQNPQDAKLYLLKAAGNFNQKVKNLIQESTITLKPVGTEPNAVQNLITPYIVFPLSLAIGITSAAILISLKTYFRL